MRRKGDFKLMMDQGILRRADPLAGDVKLLGVREQGPRKASARFEMPRDFVIPGGTPAGAALDLAPAVGEETQGTLAGDGRGAR